MGGLGMVLVARNPRDKREVGNDDRITYMTGNFLTN
jgi:hypothetical protein